MPFTLVGAFSIGLWISPKLRLAFSLRRKSAQRHLPPWAGQKRPLWIHASSGEFEYAKALVSELKRSFPLVPILVTYFSPSYEKNIADTEDVDWHEALPLDTQSATQDFLIRWKPRMLLIARTDLWPELLYQCSQARVTSILFSASFSPKKQNSFWQKLWLDLVLPLLDEIHVISSDDASFLDSQFNKKLKYYVTGDTRYDQAFARLASPRPLKTELKPPPGAAVLVAGSTWPEDEDILLAATHELISTQHFSLIVAPHEPHEAHLKSLEMAIKALSLQSIRYSQANHWRGQEILIVDKLGVLADLYSWGPLAFVGGSFRKSVHSVMEPLASGAITFVGPHHQNNREAMEFQTITLSSDDQKKPTSGEVNDEKGPYPFKMNMVEVVSSSNQWKDRLSLWLKQGPKASVSRKQIAQAVQSKTGASKKLLEHLKPKLSPQA